MKNRKETLLQHFLKERLESYVEPQRKGTPKGDPIGLSKEKYHATLLMLTNMKQEEIANQLGISHGLLRKWNTEPLFKEEVRNHHLEFILEVVEYLAYKADKGVELTKDLDVASPTYESSMQSAYTLDELRDGQSYNTTLKAMLITAFEKATPNALKKGLEGFPGIVLKAIFMLTGTTEKNPQLQKYRRDFLRLYQSQLIKGVIRILERPSAKEGERRSAVNALRLLEKSLGSGDQ